MMKQFLTIMLAMTPAILLSDTRQEENILSGIQIPELEIRQPPMEEKRLPSGALLLSAQDDSLPFLTLELSFVGGENTESPENAGTLRALANLLEIGGAGELDGDQVAEALARLGAKLSISSDYEYWSVTLTFLRQDFWAATSLLSDILLKPRLPDDRLDVVKNSLLTGIRQRNDRPDRAGRRKMGEILYPGLRRGTSLQESDVTKLTVENLRTDLERRLRAENLMVAVSGDIAGLDIEGFLGNLTVGFPENTASETEDIRYETLASAPQKFAGKIVLVKFPQAVQASIAMALHLPAHNHPDFYALQVGNYILGGGSFNSRMMSEIRAKRGLAYSAYSYNTFRSVFGRFNAGSGTRLAHAPETVRLMLDMVGQMRKEEVSEKELGLAREAILNSLVFSYEDPAAFLNSEIRFRRHRMPENYLNIFPEKIRAITREEIRNAFRKYVDPQKLVIVVSGPESLVPELEKIRPVTVIDPEQTGVAN